MDNVAKWQRELSIILQLITRKGLSTVFTYTARS